ncbi:hypothetical protein ASG63_18615 [Methylobacterium sp. Leaf94]|uniref:hypothetical protein n=1 Tax=Methylobacterium sp. Leaf94 TaxID=1736250 RepID=UPI0006F1D1BD|nr:hypothetical protein [Methylobacterium sp. Leaf94]KQU29014.1 hypothetical protein ASG63_18615 [Methylobacterium sp. Leaf94]
MVSVNGGSKGAARNLKAEYLWLDRFEEIILWFDNDEFGQTALETCVKMVKVRVANAPAGIKDAKIRLNLKRPGDIMT